MADYNSDRTGSNIDLTLDKVDALDAKVQPTATGANVTGTLTADGLTVDGTAQIVPNGTPTADATITGLQISRNAYPQVVLDAQGELAGEKLLGIANDERGMLFRRFDDAFTTSAYLAKIGSNGDVSFYEDTGTTAKMVWDASAESLGIGTASPSYPLDVVGNISAGGVFGRIRNNDTSSAATYVQMKLETGLNDAYVGAYSGSGGNGYLVFGNENTERARIDSSGNLLVGTTSDGINNLNGIKLRPLSTTIFESTTTDAVVAVNRSNSDGEAIRFLRSNALVGSISVTTTNTSYNTTSDERLKENIKDTTHNVNINNIRVREYDWIEGGEHQRFGFIAQELETVYPEAVHSPEDPEEMKSVDYSKLVPLLVKEIQQLKAEIKELKA